MARRETEFLSKHSLLECAQEMEPSAKELVELGSL
jgi:hypothetical protein